MTALLALDLGTRCGYALHVSGNTVSGTFDFKSKRYEGGGMRYLRFRQKLDEMHAAAPIGRIAFEEVRRHLSADSAHVYGGLLGVLTAWAEEHEIPYEGIPVGTLKKSATGRGNASKDDMIAAARALGYEPIDDNEADALMLLDHVLKNNGAETLV